MSELLLIAGSFLFFTRICIENRQETTYAKTREGKGLLEKEHIKESINLLMPDLLLIYFQGQIE